MNVTRLYWTTNKIRHFLSRGLAILLTLALTNSALASEILYGIRGFFGTGFAADLITIDSTTGGLDSVIGLTGMTGVGGLAVSPIDGTIYAVGGGSGTPGLHTLDPLTGAATLIGGDVTVRDMGFDSNGTLYAVLTASHIYVEGPLVTIDLTTGAVTTIGGSFSRGIGLAFDSNDTLYIKESAEPGTGDPSKLYTVDPFTGTILTSLTLDRDLNNSLAINASNVLYSFKRGTSNTKDQIFTIDTLTGTTTMLPSTIPWLVDGVEKVRLSALSFSNSLVPLPAAVWLFGSGLLGLVGIARRKKTA
jgi:hypothetical protein